MACQSIPWMRQELKAGCILANAENAADGSGLRCKDYRRLIETGLDGITLGDHVFRKKEIIEILEGASDIVRPLNLPPDAPGSTHMVLELDDGTILVVVCALGRVFMKPVDCPFRAMNAKLEMLEGISPLCLVDFHAEATSDMQIMGRMLDGRVSAVVGTHTHVATADEQILPSGTGFQSDIGMTGPFESILGRRIDAVLEATLKGLPTAFQVATEDVRLNATWMDLDKNNGRCLHIERLELYENQMITYNEEREAARKIL